MLLFNLKSMACEVESKKFREITILGRLQKFKGFLV